MSPIQYSGEGFSADVCCHLFSRAMSNRDLVVLQGFTCEVAFEVNVLRLLMKSWSVAEIYCALVIDINWRWRE